MDDIETWKPVGLAASTARRTMTAQCVGVGAEADDANAERLDVCEVMQPSGFAASPALTATTEAVAVRRGDELVLTSSDAGPGIPRGLMRRVLEPFFTTRAEGTGLGLAISRQIVELMGGRVGVEANRGRGSIYWLEIPLESPDGVTIGENGPVPTPQRAHQRVFVIENRHRDPIELQVLDAAPVSEHQEVRIESRYDPPPQDPAWNRQPGTVLWQQPLAAGATQRITAEHLISWPKDAQLREHR